MPRIRSTFNRNREGWTFENDPDLVDHIDSGRGYIRGGIGGDNGYFVGGREWRGDFSDNYGGNLSFQLRQDGSFGSGANILILGRNGTTLTLSYDVPEETTWNSFSFRLDSFGGWRVNFGSIASEEVIRSVLADVASIEIRGESRSNDTFVELNDVTLTPGRERDGDTVARVTYNDVLSTFEFGGESWNFRNDVQTFTQVETGGFRDGYLQAVDRAAGLIMYYEAPSEFEGNKAGFFGGSLSFHLRVLSGSGPSLSGDEVILVGGGLTLTWDADLSPNSDWSRYNVSLDEGGGWVVQSSGDFATNDQIRTVLENITSLSIRGEFINGSETIGLDHVRLQAPHRGFDVVDGNGDLLASRGDLQQAINTAERLDADTIIVSLRDNQAPASGSYETTQTQLTIIDGEDQLRGASFTMGDRARSLEINGGSNLTVIGNQSDNDIDLRGVSGTVRVNADGGLDNQILVSGRADARISGADVAAGSDEIVTRGGNDRIDGQAGDDVIDAGGGRNRVIGGLGDDILIAEGGRDTFIFRPGHGQDTIFDFELDADRIRVQNFGGRFDDASDVLSAARVIDGSVVLRFGEGDRITLDGISRVEDLSADNFVIV